MGLPVHSVAILLLAAAVGGCSAEKPLDPRAEAKRIAFCASVIHAVKPGDKTCGPYLDKARQELERQKVAAEAARPKAADPNGWRVSNIPGIYWRWCAETDCSRSKVIGDNSAVLIQIWCKTSACGNIYGRVNLISSSDVVVGWTNDTAYGDQGQKVQLTFQSGQDDWTKARLTELNIGGVNAW